MATDENKSNRVEESKLDQELKQIELQMKRLQLEDLTTRVDQERARRANILRQRNAQEEALSQTNRDIIASQSLCRHKKGGTDEDGVLNGDDNRYSVIKHTYPWGETVVMCTRCGKEWKPPKRELARTDRKAYDAQLEAWRAAMVFPTDNKPSGSQIFQFHYPMPDEPKQGRRSA